MDSSAAGWSTGRCAQLEQAARFVHDELLWLPGEGIGYFPVAEPPHLVYDGSYFANYEKLAATDMGRAITAARVALVRQHVGSRWLVDFGIGCGAFVEAMAPQALGFDVMPQAQRWLHERQRFHDPWREGADVLTCWDSLEHVRYPHLLLSKVHSWLFVSLPIFRDGEHARSSKHFKPREHYWYWTARGFERWLGSLGFAVVEMNRMETGLGREDIGTFVARRSGG